MGTDQYKVLFIRDICDICVGVLALGGSDSRIFLTTDRTEGHG